MIPSTWCPETQQCIDDQDMTPDARSDIVRTLVTLLTARVGPNPTHDQLGDIARQLVLKYPFMQDDLGNGYVS